MKKDKMVKPEKNGTKLINVRRRRSKTGQREEKANDVAHICSPQQSVPKRCTIPQEPFIAENRRRSIIIARVQQAKMRMHSSSSGQRWK